MPAAARKTSAATARGTTIESDRVIGPERDSGWMAGGYPSLPHRVTPARTRGAGGHIGRSAKAQSGIAQGGQSFGRSAGSTAQIMHRS
jgi:hypothetical protein